MKPSTHPGTGLAEVFRSHRAELVRLAAFILGDRGTGEDVVQDGGLSWTPDGRTLVVDYYWTTLFEHGPALAVLGLDAASDGGSLEAHSRLLWH